jgi:hypothetical protein
MTTTQTRLMELALIGLESEKRRIEDELVDLRQRMGRSPAASKAAAPPVGQNTLGLKRVSFNKGKKMSAAQKRKISQTMKALWASRKRAK